MCIVAAGLQQVSLTDLEKALLSSCQTDFLLISVLIHFHDGVPKPGQKIRAEVYVRCKIGALP